MATEHPWIVLMVDLDVADDPELTKIFRAAGLRPIITRGQWTGLQVTDESFDPHVIPRPIRDAASRLGVGSIDFDNEAVPSIRWQFDGDNAYVEQSGWELD